MQGGQAHTVYPDPVLETPHVEFGWHLGDEHQPNTTWAHARYLR